MHISYALYIYTIYTYVNSLVYSSMCLSTHLEVSKIRSDHAR